MARISWNRTQATRELAYSIFQRASTDEIKNKLGDFLGSQNTQNEIKKNLERLSYGKQSLETAYNDLLRNLIKEGYYDQNGILDQLNNVLSTNGSLSTRENLLSNMLNQNSNISSSLELKINNYFYNYESMYNNILNASESVQKIMDNIRGDQSLYALGVDKQLTLMTASTYTQFERDNRNLFNLSFSKDKNGNYSLNQLQARKGIDNQTLVDSLKQLYNNNSDKMILNLFDNKINSSGITFGQVWDQLQSTRIEAKEFSQKYMGQHKELGPSRKLEFLLSGEFQNVTTLNGIQDVIKQNQGQRSMSENIFGFATGDVNAQTQVGRLGIQAKYSNGEMPWNGTSVNGLINTLTFLSNKDNLVQNVINNTMKNADTATANEFFKQTFGLPFDKVGWRAQEYVYNELDTMFSDAFADNPLFYSFLASQQCEDIKDNIFNDYTESYEEDTENGIEDYDGGDENIW